MPIDSRAAARSFADQLGSYPDLSDDERASVRSLSRKATFLQLTLLLNDPNTRPNLEMARADDLANGRDVWLLTGALIGSLAMGALAALAFL
jgi:hypothetical protein